MKIPFLDLGGQYKEIKEDIDFALRRSLKRSDFILGKDEVIFEKEFAKYFNRKFAVGVNSGTDALFLGLLSLGIGSGDEVIVPVFTYIATALAVTFTGARPVFVDIDQDSYNIEVDKISGVITEKTKAIIPVHLYGQSAHMKPILNIGRKYNLKIVEDAAQAHGARYKMPGGKWRMVGGIGDIGCFSFYPTKNLGGCGDGGMIVTDDEKIYKKILLLRDYGRKSRYEHISVGYNSRLDTIQAAILRIKLRHLERWNIFRRRNAAIYNRELKDTEGMVVPKEADYAKHVYHVYAVRVRGRDWVVKELAKKGIGTLIYYPIPLHLQKVYKDLGYKKGDFPVAEKVAQEIISLPMYPHLKEAQIRLVAQTLKGILR
jgi:dTDP-4-amino-4,6-dideoxygalactose transaminase